MRNILATLAVASVVAAVTSVAIGQPSNPRGAIAKAVASTTRTPANVARDRYRHPTDTLAFFRVKPTDTVVELIPGGGWYTEILAPYLAQRGTYYAAGAWANGLNGIKKLQGADAATYGKVRLAAFPAAAGEPVVPAGSADVVLTFRNIHNLRFAGVDRTQAAFSEMYRMLKPGGTLGIVEHRLPEARDAAAEEKSGYMKVSSVVAFAKQAGFVVSEMSEVNANPKDTADWPEGVWTLPPTYRLKDVDRAKYAAIGESDRMTIRFTKPRK
ncbi:methyltransferase domain-containing protein [Sphingomonas donggukensis]|uniref:Methyltransferase domain-containing protein n=1 Tax=Sphingomonas donggukensis TaxID=2949093 RepID=A0ABY4TZG3_9SPHN|nr:methyltransferase domain-containing protein [Sphingomonas donggukensis]URW75936.1 methyltransferase domain-containing protein [Sphingomonas donggukensis]